MVYVRAQVRNNLKPVEHPSWWADVARFFERGETIATTAKALGLTLSQVSYARKAQGLTLAAGAGYNKKKVFERGVKNRMARRLEDPVIELAPFAECFAQGFKGQKGRLDIFQVNAATCKFPIDQDQSLPLFCGLETVGGKSWCAHHFERCTGVEYKARGHFKLGSMLKLGTRAKVAV